MAQLEVGGERYGFSKVDLQTVIWGKEEIMAFGNIFRNLYKITDIARKLQILLISTTFILYRSLLGLENIVKWAWEWNLRGGQGNDTWSGSIRPR